MCLGTPPCMHRCTAQRRNSQHTGEESAYHGTRSMHKSSTTTRPSAVLLLSCNSLQQSVPSTINTSSFLLPPFSPTSVSGGGHGMDPFSALARASWEHWQSSLAAPLYRCRATLPESRVDGISGFFAHRPKSHARSRVTGSTHSTHTHFSPFTVCLCMSRVTLRRNLKSMTASPCVEQQNMLSSFHLASELRVHHSLPSPAIATRSRHDTRPPSRKQQCEHCR